MLSVKMLGLFPPWEMAARWTHHLHLAGAVGMDVPAGLALPLPVPSLRAQQPSVRVLLSGCVSGDQAESAK